MDRPTLKLVTEEERKLLRERLAMRRPKIGRDSEIVRDYLSGQSMCEIASGHNITRQRVQQVIKRESTGT